MKIFKIIESIFFDGEHDIPLPRFRSETEHYKKEIRDMYLDEVEVMISYRDIHDILEAYKYRSEVEKGDILARLFDVSSLLAEKKGEGGISIVPVPMHWTRYIIRGYNHIYLLCKKISKARGIRVDYLLGTRISWRQSQLSKNKRIENRASSIYLKKSVKIPKEVLLIDDVISTGSTANACAKVLKEAGVEKVYGIFLASNRD